MYQNQSLKQINRKRDYIRFKDKVRVADLAEMGLSLSSKNRGVKYLLCMTDVSTKYTWFKTLNDKKS